MASPIHHDTDEVRQAEPRPMARHTLMNSLLLGVLALAVLGLIVTAAG